MEAHGKKTKRLLMIHRDFVDNSSSTVNLYNLILRALLSLYYKCKNLT